MRWCEISSPAGRLLLAGDGHALSRIHFQDGPHPMAIPDGWERTEEPFADAIGELDAYFAGRLTKFQVPIAPEGTPFQREVWTALTRIPYGETVSYGELTRRLGRPNASRAVGAANGRNPIPIIVPCHRVVGANGALTGFGGGLSIKRMLLDLEAEWSGRPTLPIASVTSARASGFPEAPRAAAPARR
ncbi:MAG TPA: methylated-DNA--[protein]-cysteine S-methyltransferase [Thermoanaerobaculia bacterium]